jgi:hypothetical protein
MWNRLYLLVCSFRPTMTASGSMTVRLLFALTIATAFALTIAAQAGSDAANIDAPAVTNAKPTNSNEVEGTSFAKAQ